MRVRAVRGDCDTKGTEKGGEERPPQKGNHPAQSVCLPSPTNVALGSCEQMRSPNSYIAT